MWKWTIQGTWAHFEMYSYETITGNLIKTHYDDQGEFVTYNYDGIENGYKISGTDHALEIDYFYNNYFIDHTTFEYHKIG